MHRADLDLDAEHPVLQYGYGSYEASMDPYFSIPRLSLLDRGVIYVVAHVRGGGELGRAWYTDGKKLAKRNTFTDFIAVTDHLAAQPWADAARIVAEGGSAGGLLMGAVANLAPRKYAGILAVVPFVDPVTSISDPQLPLSALEWEEWGNPIEDERVYRYMRGYAPYENVAALPYPPIAAITSLNDTRVLYVEPAKWVPALREASTSGAPVLLRTEMDGGHGGGSAGTSAGRTPPGSTPSCWAAWVWPSRPSTTRGRRQAPGTGRVRAREPRAGIGAGRLRRRSAGWCSPRTPSGASAGWRPSCGCSPRGCARAA
ncbi:hypothetical protein A5N15_01155 [Rothia kristinae]|uniref:Peptidase S9 prolyl oligopeptidase catalytic domain-containing protein n=1 Tax=Rothia kristinae TaxID=37923 RepID=A0A657IW65_9MICC|nr:hypothetical protein A5N15_01155 [Rothia kristinae]